MTDLSPEKLIVLLVIGLLVLGPDRLPAAARAVATGLHRARHVARSLTEPLQASLDEPRNAAEAAMSELRSAISPPSRPAPVPRAELVPQAGLPHVPTLQTDAAPFDPGEN